MKKYLLKIVLFFGIVFVVDLGYGKACAWLQAHAKGGITAKIYNTAQVQEAEIVIMGSSRAHHHYSPSVIREVTGLAAYNAGVDGNGVVLSTGLYDMIRERYSPKVILYDVEPAFDINVYAEDGNNTRYIGWLRPYFDYSQVKDIVCRVDASERYKNLSAMFRYNSKVVDMLKDFVVLTDYTTDGYSPMFGEMKTEPTTQGRGGITQRDSLKLSIMEVYISNVCKTDTKLIMIASPKYGAVTSKVFDPIKEMCKQYGVEFWDFYCSPEFQRLEYFKEPMHLNDKGARAFSESVAHKLCKNLF